ncbi:hypothetical protein T492DRAFT_932781 [Pavlovales sp. CCMP2436]|nr:hypothetical protein T492DRAFT_932781 [Pavlovales sp. CCMP2436]
MNVEGCWLAVCQVQANLILALRRRLPRNILYYQTCMSSIARDYYNLLSTFLGALGGSQKEKKKKRVRALC